MEDAKFCSQEEPWAYLLWGVGMSIWEVRLLRGQMQNSDGKLDLCNGSWESTHNAEGVQNDA